MSDPRRIRWLVRRASAMGPGEIGLRASRALRDRRRRRAAPTPQSELLSFGEAIAGGEDIGPLEALRRVRPLTAGDPSDVAVSTLERLGARPSETVEEAERVLGGSIPAFGHGRLDVGPEPDWHRDPASGLSWPDDVWWSDVDFRFDPEIDDPRYVWEVNRHLHLTSLARAFVLTGNEQYARAAWRQMADWVRRNPPYFGVNWASVLEVGIRLISWTLTMGLLGGAGASENDVRDVLTSCSLQARHVSDNLTFYGSSRNNHLIGEAAGLLAAGVALPFLDGSNLWIERAWRVLDREVPGQLSSDGVSLEQTFHYQVFVVEFALVTAACAKALGRPLQAPFLAALGRAVDTLRSLADGAVAPPRVGDEDGGRAYVLDERPKRQARAAVAAGLLVDRGRLPQGLEAADLASAMWLFGSDAVGAALDEPRTYARPPRMAFPVGGYFVQGDGRAHSVVDCGPLGLGTIAAHGHADCLSLEVAYDGEWLVVDPGTYCYHRERAWRDHFRSTGAHNTVSVDDADQSEMLGPFLWGARAEAEPVFWSGDERLSVFRGRHDGYVRRFGATHERTVVFLKGGAWIVLDRIEGAGRRRVRSSFQLAPGLDLSGPPDGGRTAFEGSDGRRVAVAFWGPEGTETGVARGSVEPTAGWVSDGFGRKTEASVVTASFTGALPLGVLSVITVDGTTGVNVDLADDGLGARLLITSGSETQHLLVGTYSDGATVFDGLAGYTGSTDIERATLGAGVSEWTEDGRAVDFERIGNELPSGRL